MIENSINRMKLVLDRVFSKKEHTSATVYADCTMSKIDAVIRSGMTDEQLNAVREALVALRKEERHQIDIRIGIPLYFARYYLVIFGGRDRTSSTYALERARTRGGKNNFVNILLFLLFTILVTAVWIGVFIVVYWVKQDMGIDIFPDFHLPDFLGRRSE